MGEIVEISQGDVHENPPKDWGDTMDKIQYWCPEGNLWKFLNKRWLSSLQRAEYVNVAFLFAEYLRDTCYLRCMNFFVTGSLWTFPRNISLREKYCNWPTKCYAISLFWEGGWQINFSVYPLVMPVLVQLYQFRYHLMIYCSLFGWPFAASVLCSLCKVIYPW